MRDESNAWRRQLGAISRGMLSLQGWTDEVLPAPAATPPPRDAAAGTMPARERQRPKPRALRRLARHLWRDLLYLGGRPMSATHADDSNEPFAGPRRHKRVQSHG